MANEKITEQLDGMLIYSYTADLHGGAECKFSLLSEVGEPYKQWFIDELQARFYKVEQRDAPSPWHYADYAVPMEVMRSEGCTAFYTTINGKLLYGENAMTDEERKHIIDFLLRRLHKEIVRSTVSIDQVIDLFQYDKYETDDYRCDQCGDTVGRTYWTI